MDKNKQMSRLRLAILPVADHELGKFLPMCAMIFLTIFAYSLLRAFKDTIIVQAPGAGALLLPFLKTYAVFPSSLLAAIGYMRLRKNVDAGRAYYVCVSLFIAFFAILSAQSSGTPISLRLFGILILSRSFSIFEINASTE